MLLIGRLRWEIAVVLEIREGMVTFLGRRPRASSVVLGVLASSSLSTRISSFSARVDMAPTVSQRMHLSLQERLAEAKAFCQEGC